MTARSRREMIRSLAMGVSISTLGHAQSNEDQARDYVDEEGYKVYSTIIPRDPTDPGQTLVIEAQTFSFAMCLAPEGESAPILEPAIANYQDLARRRWHLIRKFSLSKPYTLVEKRDLDGYFEKGSGGWEGFYSRYPKSGGYFFLSPVGFNSSKDVAVVAMTHSCGPLCADGKFSVLRKKDGEWKPLDWKGSRCVWAA